MSIIETLDRFCVYGVASDYDGMLELLRYRLEEIQTTHEAVDAVSGLHGGYTSKIVAPTPIRTLGRVSLGPMLQTLGLALIVVRDDEQFARVKDRLAKRERPRVQLPMGSIPRPSWLFTRKMSNKLQSLRSEKVTPQHRKRIAKKAAKAMWRKRRKSMRTRLKERAEAKAK